MVVVMTAEAGETEIDGVVDRVRSAGGDAFVSRGMSRTIVGLVGSISAGITTIPLNPDTGDKELAHILADAKPRAIFSAHPERDRARTPSVPVHDPANCPCT